MASMLGVRDEFTFFNVREQSLHSRLVYHIDVLEFEEDDRNSQVGF